MRGRAVAWCSVLGLLVLTGCPKPTDLSEAYIRHIEWQEYRDAWRLESAIDAYSQFVASCPGADECQEAFRALGVLSMEAGRYREAAQAFREATEIDPSTEIAVAAARGQIGALEAWMGVPAEGMGTTRWSAGPPLIDTERPPSPTDQPLPLDPVEQMLVAAADTLLWLDGEFDDPTGMRYQTAFLLYQRRHYDDASARWLKMAGEDPKSPETASAFRILIPTHHAREAWTDLVRDGTFFLELDGLSLSAEERANLETMVQEAQQK